MMKRLLLALLIGLLFLANLHLATAQPNTSITWTDIRDYALRLDKLRKALPEPQIEASDALLQAWMLEMLPFYEEVGISRGQATAPESVKFAAYSNAMGHIHVLGQSDCGQHIFINARMLNPVSAWHNRIDFIGTIAHEMVHQQQGVLCHSMPINLVETTAQVGMVEVLSAMSLGGNKLSARALLNELFDMSMASAKAFSLDPKYASEYSALEAQVYTTALERGRALRSRLSWKGKEAQLQQILLIYNLDPLSRLMVACRGDKTISGLAIPNPKPLNVSDFCFFNANMEAILAGR
jgi:hypothetical protein